MDSADSAGSDGNTDSVGSDGNTDSKDDTDNDDVGNAGSIRHPDTFQIVFRPFKILLWHFTW